ncbi:MAG: response regulator transcription factor [Caldilineales bacterium]|nr:response regulator transcription factor [Caldilineales bacterium]
MSHTPAHILIVEDERAVARGLEYALQNEGFEVVWAQTGRQAIDFAHSEKPDAILLDIRLPDINGFDVCKQLRGAGMRQPILMVTARDEEVDKVLGLELGADDYIVKPYSLREVISRIRAQLRRAYGELSAVQSSRHFVFGDIEIDPERFLVTKGGEPLDLTPTEFRLLTHLVANPGHPLTREGLIEAVWGYDSELGYDRTVDVHMRRLRQKLEDDPANPRWFVTVRGVGYKFQPD